VIDGLKPYPRMKDSGVPWLGDVPEHWEVQRLRKVAEMRVSNVDKHTNEDEETIRLCNYVDVYKHDRITSRMPFMRATATPRETERFRLCAGDVLITKDSESWTDIGVPALVEESSADLVCGYHLALLRPFIHRATGEFLFRALQSSGVSYQFHVEANGVTRYGLSHASIKSVWLPVPPLPEQCAIVRFIDHAERRIRRYIGAKEKLIKLLEEQKQAIIHRAVARGIDPNVRLKPSGAEWLDDVPVHWEVLSVRRVIRRAVDGPHHSPSYLDKGIPFLSARNVKADRWSLDDAKFISEEDYKEFSKRIRPEAGDVLYTKGGTTGIARAVDLDFRFQVWVHVAVLKVKLDKIISGYLALVLNSPRCYEQAQLFTRGATNQDLGLGRMKAIVFALPPLREQGEILKAVEGTTQEIQQAIYRAGQEIELLREYRTRLIADVVTGKLDVREAAARLPEMPAERERPEEDMASTEFEMQRNDDLERETAEADE
jgi:type I restriction enzyme, S subunit